MRIRTGIILVLVAVASSSALAAESPSSALALLRQRILNSIGKLPWNAAEGYGLGGRFILKATGEEIPYQTRFVRASNRWAADFSQEDRSRNLRYAFSRKSAWVTSPEITADAPPELLPYMARFDFPQLCDALIRILERGAKDPAFGAGTIANEIHISGKLQNGWNATFVLNTVEFFPRKVLITIPGEQSTALLLPFARPDGSCSLSGVPGMSSEFEIWLSEPVDGSGYRYARRLDYVERGSVLGTFFQEESFPISDAEALFRRPEKSPWSGSLNFDPHANLPGTSIYLNRSDLTALRSRIEESPWAGWNRENRLIVFWGIVVSWIGHLFPSSITLRLTLLAEAVFLLGLIFLLMRRRRQTGDTFRWGLLLAGMVVCGLVLIARAASIQFHSSRDRSLIALHSAIRYSVTGRKFYAQRTDALLRNFENEAPAQSLEDLGSACQAYALAYDLIRPMLSTGRRVEVRGHLFNYARPLFGACNGWVSNTYSSSGISAGLGMVGLAIGCEPFVKTACAVMDKTLKTQLAGGLHQSGPGQGAEAMDAAANLFYGLKRTKRADFYSNSSFQQYLQATLQMLSPLGTLPLFDNTSLDHSAQISALFLKTANHVSDAQGRQCVAAHDLFWNRGRYYAQGWVRWIFPAIQPLMMSFENPYLILQYTRTIPPSLLPSSSVVAGGGQAAVLRTGTDPDSAYLALNMTRSHQASHRDILTFDVYAYRSLMLHGPGFPGRDRPGYRESVQTSSANSITLNNEDQAATQCTGIESFLLNQPVFDYVRALADSTYDYGQVQRSVIMVRPEKNHPAYFVLFDDVSVSNRETTVQWYLHGRGKLVTGIDPVSRWTSTTFSPAKLIGERVVLEAAHPIGEAGKLIKKPGLLYSQFSLLNQDSVGTVIEWAGSKRFCTILAPRKSGEAWTKIETLGKNLCRIGTTDWIGMGGLDVQAANGPFAHISEYALVRNRAGSFPAILMISGLECRFGPHSVFSTKPVTASLKGLRGGFLNSRPDTRVEIRSPEIRAGDRFFLDGQTITADKSGLLLFVLRDPGEHSLR